MNVRLRYESAGLDSCSEVVSSFTVMPAVQGIGAQVNV
jgi:hypothetical protein